MSTELATASTQTEHTALLSLIERIATDPSADVVKLEKMLDMQERIFNKNAEIEFNKAFSEMQADMPVITEHGEIKVKDEVRSKYARFEDINETIKPILRKHGFGISFRTTQSEQTQIVTCVLMHRAGHKESTELPLPFDQSGSKNNVQAIGSSVSYGKRYTLCAILNITSRGEDDDGTSAKPTPRISEQQIADLNALITEVGASKSGFLKWLKVGAIGDIPEHAYRAAVAALEAKRRHSKGKARGDR